LAVQASKEFFLLIRKTKGFVNISVKRKAIFTEMQTHDPNKPIVLVLLDLCDHKWNFRERAVTVIHNRFSHLLEAIEFIAENGKPDERFEAEGILTQLMKPLTICLLVTLSDVFSQFGPLSDVLQAEKCDLASALKLTSAHLQLLKDKRSDEYFHKLWLVITNLATANNIEMSLPARSPKSSFHFEAVCHRINSRISRHRR
jgi:hypothetical protein